MIRITRETDYGILLLAAMDREGGGESSQSARELANWVGVSLPMASKILKRLARAEILRSNRGAKGGYALARALDRVSIADVVQALEGPIGLVECVAHPGSCEQEGECPTSINWKRVNRVLREALEQVMLSEMVGPSPSSPLLRVGAGGGR